MPELPEVETTARGIAPHITDTTIRAVTIRERRLRQPVTRGFAIKVIDQRIERVTRRAKYILLGMQHGSIIVHLGMSGSLRITKPDTPAEKHDHIDLIVQRKSGELCCLRYRDPRRFGRCIYTPEDPLRHPLLTSLGPEPFAEEFDADYLFRVSRARRGAIKNLIMDSKIVTGVGNIYASESLFRARIHPQRAAGRISKARYARLVPAIQTVLSEAIAHGGTTLRDFVSETGQPGYFRNELNVYGREGELCPCGRAAIKQRVIGQRASYYCACQR